MSSSLPASALVELIPGATQQATFGGIAANLQLVVVFLLAAGAIVASVFLLYRWKNRPSG